VRRRQQYPAKTVKIIAPVQPGGGVGPHRAHRGRAAHQVDGRSPFIVENVSGGGGVDRLADGGARAPDGYTLMLGYVATHGTVPAVRKVPYDAVKDFTPIAMVGGHAQRAGGRRGCR
jgi:tripartite-type tricarboxylate transporter receptor subunit TctC